MSLTAPNHVHSVEGISSDYQHGDDRCSCGLAQHGANQVYNETAFEYFLALERNRSELSSRPLLLMLVDLKKQNGTNQDLDARLAVKLFAALSQSLRDTDVIGWYREQQIAGAVLTFADGPEPDASSRIAERVSDALSESLSSDIVRRLQVRVYQLPAPVAR
jgi:hypothetical protein